MAVYYGTNFDTLQRAMIDQQEADTRAAAIYQQFLTNLAQQRNQAEQTASRERLGNRQYQSEDRRTDSGERVGMRRTDVEESLGTDRNAIDRLNMLNQLMLGNNRQLVAEGELDLKRQAEARAAAQFEKELETRKTIAGIQAKAEADRLAAADAARLNYLQLQQAGNPTAARYRSQAELDQQEQQNQQLRAVLEQINKSTARTTPGWIWDSKIPVAAQEKALLDTLQRLGGSTNQATILNDDKGRPMLVPRLNPTSSTVAPPAAPPGPATRSPQPRINKLGQVYVRNLQNGQLELSPDLQSALADQRDGLVQIVAE